jgi:hypothetical protein
MNLELAAGMVAQVVKTVMSRLVEMYRREERVAVQSPLHYLRATLLHSAASWSAFLAASSQRAEWVLVVVSEKKMMVLVDVEKLVLEKARS